MIVNVLNSVDPLNYKYLCINMDMPKPQGMIYQTCILGCQLMEGEDNELNINLHPLYFPNHQPRYGESRTYSLRKDIFFIHCPIPVFLKPNILCCKFRIQG